MYKINNNKNMRETWYKTPVRGFGIDNIFIYLENIFLWIGIILLFFFGSILFIIYSLLASLYYMLFPKRYGWGGVRKNRKDILKNIWES